MTEPTTTQDDLVMAQEIVARVMRDEAGSLPYQDMTSDLFEIAMHIEMCIENDVPVVLVAIAAERARGQEEMRRAVAAEREACAKAAFHAHNPDEQGDGLYSVGHHDGVNAAIRNRGAGGLGEG